MPLGGGNSNFVDTKEYSATFCKALLIQSADNQEICGSACYPPMQQQQEVLFIVDTQSVHISGEAITYIFLFFLINLHSVTHKDGPSLAIKTFLQINIKKCSYEPSDSDVTLLWGIQVPLISFVGL